MPIKKQTGVIVCIEMKSDHKLKLRIIQDHHPSLSILSLSTTSNQESASGFGVPIPYQSATTPVKLSQSLQVLISLSLYLLSVPHLIAPVSPLTLY